MGGRSVRGGRATIKGQGTKEALVLLIRSSSVVLSLTFKALHSDRLSPSAYKHYYR